MLCNRTVSFTWNIDPTILHLGPLQIRYYGLFFMFVFIGGFWLFRWQVQRAGGSEEQAADIILPSVVGVLVGARLGHVFFYEFDRFLRDPLWIFEFWKGGLASHGAAIGVPVMLLYYARKHRQSWIECFDRFTFSIALSAILVRTGNFFNSEIVGRVTDQTWGVRFPRYDRIPNPPLRHPTQFYEAGIGLLILLLLWAVDRWAGKEKRPRGLLTSVFFISYFAMRFGVEFFKEYQTLSPSFPLTMGQILSVIPFFCGLVGLIVALKKRVPSHWTPEPVANPSARAQARRAARAKNKNRKKKKR